MKRICFTLDEVIRAKFKQFGKIYKKYVDNDIILEDLDLSSGDLCEIFFNGDIKAYNKFLYEDYPFEIFAEAKTTTPAIDKKFILWHMDLVEDEDMDEEIEISLANPYEFNASIGNTCFFLSKIATRVRNIYFPQDSSEIWKKCDILVTADKKLIESKPDGKMCIKIKTPFNDGLEADAEYNNLEEFFKDNEMQDFIKNGRED